MTAAAVRAFEDYKSQLRDVLGKRYREGEQISFERQRYKANLKLTFGKPIEFTWRSRTATYTRLFDLYISPRSNVPGWVVFLALYPGSL